MQTLNPRFLRIRPSCVASVPMVGSLMLPTSANFKTVIARMLLVFFGGWLFYEVKLFGGEGVKGKVVEDVRV